MAKRITDKMRTKQEKLNRRRRRKAKVRQNNKSKPQAPGTDSYFTTCRQRDSLFAIGFDVMDIPSVDIRPIPHIPGWVPEITKFQKEVS